MTAISDQSLRVRVSNLEREQVVDILGRHFAEGRLSLDEFEERLDAAFQGKTWLELLPLLEDLPPVQASAPSRRGRAARRPFLRIGSRHAVRVVSVATVVAVAAATGPAALLLLWPAFSLTSAPKEPSEPSPWIRVAGAPAVRVLATVGTVALATLAGSVALLLLWPAFALTRRPRSAPAPAAIQVAGRRSDEHL